MKKEILILAVAGWAVCSMAAESNKDADGGNAAGSEKVCLISNASTTAFKDSIKKCKRGDILALGGITNLGAMQFCDFSKAIMHEQGSPIACVYTGIERPAIK